MLDRQAAPPSIPITQIGLQEPVTLLLKNGIALHVIEAGSQDVVRVDVITKGGSTASNRSLVAGYTAKMLTEGSANFTSGALAAKVDHYGASLHAEADADECIITLHCLGKHLEELAPLITEVLERPTFPEHELNTVLQNGRQEWLVNQKKVGNVARVAFGHALYGASHPYGRSAIESDYQNLTRDALVAHHHLHNQHHIEHVLVAGRITPAGLKKLADELGATNNQTAPNAHTLPNPQTSVGLTSVAKDGAVQNAIRMGRILFGREHPDHIDLSVLVTILGGHFGSRLMNNLREDKGYTYGINAGIQSYATTGHLVVATEVGADVSADALAQIDVELATLRNETIPAAELDLVRNYLLGRALNAVDGPFALSDKWRMYLKHGLGPQNHAAYVDRLHSVNTQRLQELANIYLDPSVWSTTVVGKV